MHSIYIMYPIYVYIMFICNDIVFLWQFLFFNEKAILFKFYIRIPARVPNHSKTKDFVSDIISNNNK